MRTIGAHAARTHFGQVLSEVEQGATIIVTRHGVPVARIVPIRHELKDSAAAIEEYRRFRDEHHVTLGEGLTIRDLIEDGRR